MHIHVLQHVPFEGLGSIFPWGQSQGATISTTKLFESANLPTLSEFDVLIALGGPMSVNDEASLPWLRDEKRFVRETIDSGKPVLGICLGAQLMASSLGARVYPGTNKEIGWFPVVSCAQRSDCFVFPDETEVFHWHGETFDLPADAIHLAKSEACFHQAFQVGARAIGLQFHLETTPQSAADILSNCRHELVPAKFVQSEQELRSVPASRYLAINALMENVLSYITRSGA
jgi:GMP synthase-like glutamine amidotransferase